MSKKSKEKIGVEVIEEAPCVKKINFTIAKENVLKETNKLAKTFAGQVNIPGFRVGNAPLGLIKKKFAKELKQELIKEFFNNAIQEMNDLNFDIVAHAKPEEEPPELDLNKEYEFSFTINTAPEIEDFSYDKIKLNSEKIDIKDDVVEKEIQSYRENYGKYVDITEGKAEEGDILKVAYSSDFDIPEGSEDKMLKSLVETDNNSIWLNKQELIPGITECLTGSEIGKEYSLSAKFPKDFRVEDLSEKTVEYKIKVLSIQRKALADDETLMKLMQVKTIEDLSAQIKSGMEANQKSMQQQKLGKDALESIVKDVKDFNIPPLVIEQEASKMLYQTKNKITKKEEGDKFIKEADSLMEKYKVDVLPRLKEVFIVRKIAELEELNVTDEELQKSLDEFAKYYAPQSKITPSEFKQRIKNNGGEEDIRMDLLQGKVIELILDKADIKEK